MEAAFILIISSFIQYHQYSFLIQNVVAQCDISTYSYRAHSVLQCSFSHALFLPVLNSMSSHRNASIACFLWCGRVGKHRKVKRRAMVMPGSVPIVLPLIWDFNSSLVTIHEHGIQRVIPYRYTACNHHSKELSVDLSSNAHHPLC